MGDLTQGAIDAVLGTLATAILDETRVIGNVRRDMKFIKDEMDSMNGFLLHLNKLGNEHDDQVRAWMKQVREVSYIAEDCVDRYLRIVDRYGAGWGGGGGCVGTLRTMAFCVVHPKVGYRLSKLAEQIAELKARVQDVGERRQRYDVKVPDGTGLKVVQSKLLPDQVEEEREGFVQKLEKEDDVGTPAWFRSPPVIQAMDTALTKEAPAPALTKEAPAPTPGTAAAAAAEKEKEQEEEQQPDPFGELLLEDALVRQLPDDSTARSAAPTMRAILKKCSPLHRPGEDKKAAKAADVDPDEAAAFRCTRNMFLCAMYVYPYTTDEELKKLKDGVTAHGVAAKEARYQVMVFCYSLLSTHQKSCLQYLTAFLHEKEISRTSMVRRWVAEGLVGKDGAAATAATGGGGSSTTTPEDAGERCFRELLLRGFVRAARRSDAGTVKSCKMDVPISDFIKDITKSENFAADLPPHLERQLKIRKIVQSRDSAAPPPVPVRRRCHLRCCYCTWLVDDHGASEEEAKDPMDELVEFIDTLPELYRLNVLDLGGCTGLRTRHLERFAAIDCLKYLSLRDTDVSRLNADHINKLTLLETLDIRDTNIRSRDTASIYLPRLKHLLAGRFVKGGTTTAAAVERASLVTVRMPGRIGSMKEMQTLSHVEVSMDGAELQDVAKLHQLRKLGVVVHANAPTAGLLGRVLYILAGNLRSLSVWVAVAVPHTTATATAAAAAATTTTQQGSGTGILDISSMYEMASNLVLENLDIKGKMSLPSWIGRAPKLANVTLRDTEMDGGDALRRLATVPSLRCLKISRKAFTEQVLRFKDVEFQALKILVVEGDAATRIDFLAGEAAPKLERIVWVIGGGSSKIAQMYNQNFITGIENLESLKEIELRASFKLTTITDWTKRQQEEQNAPKIPTTPPSVWTEKKKEKNRTYRIRYVSSSDGQLITELLRFIDTHKTLSLPAGVIN